MTDSTSFYDPESLAVLDKYVLQSIIDKLKEWLGEDGIKFFMDLQEKHNTVSPVLMIDGIPHPVHLREGMQVRNFLRTIDECEAWDCHLLDDHWALLVEEAIK